MAKVRAYKIAEELGLEKEEFLSKAAEIGIELRSHLVGVDDEQAETLRRRLGGIGVAEREEKRVGTSVIRRRRKKSVSAPEPEPEVIEEVPAVAAPELVIAPEEVPPVPEPVIEPVLEPPSEIEPVAVPEPVVAAPTDELPVPPEPAAEKPPTVPAPVAPAPLERVAEQPPAKRLTRRKVLEGVALKEQDQLTRSMRGNVQQRLEQRRLIVEHQSRTQLRGRKRVARPGKAESAPGPRRMLLKLSGAISFQELSKLTGVKLRELIRRARALGAELDRSSLVDLEMAQLLAEDTGFEVQRTTRNIEESVEAANISNPEELEPRPPIVTVMGHVDHGKTTLLDSIRRTNVVEGEAGGITQHIGAYQVTAGDSQVTFIDTPGHAAFTNMRARGAQVTDIAVLVVAADDGIMPQTIEAIDHARAAEVPIIVAINKIDRPDADPERAKRGLLEQQLVPEEFGGDVICVEVSAKQGTNVDKLLEMLALQAEVLELGARRKGNARGTVIEAQLDRGQGPVATVLVQEGTLHRGDAIVVGAVCGRVRTLVNDQGATLKEAPPATPVQIVGLSGVPDAGEEVIVVKNEREAKNIVEHRMAEERRAKGEAATGPVPDQAEDIFAAMDDTEGKELRLVMKADVRGTMEAIVESVDKLSTEEVKLSVIHSSVGAISESDIMLASASDAVVIGFHVRPEATARRAAEREAVMIRTFDVVYELIDDVKSLVLGLLPPTLTERVSGHAEVRELFVIPRVGTVAGCYVAEGMIRRSNLIRVIRDGIPVYSGKLNSLRRFKDDVREVQGNLECGIRIEDFNDVKVGDILESYLIEETRPTG